MIAAAIGIGRFAYTPLLPGMQEALAWTVAQAGDVASANYLGYLLGAMVASWLVRHSHRHSVLFAGMVFSGLTTIAGAWISSYTVWLTLRFFSGIASAICLVIGTAILVEVFVRHSHSKLSPLYFSGVAFGIIASVLIIETVRHFAYSVFVQWGVLGFVSFLMLAVAWVVLRRLRTEKDSFSSSITTETAQPSNGHLQRLIVAYGFFGFGYVVTATFIVAIARQFENAAVLEPLTWIVVGVVGGPSLFFWHYLSTRIGVFTALRIAFGIEAAGVLLAGIASNAFSVVVGGALLGGTFMGITAMGLSAARHIAKSNQDRAIAWMTMSFGLGQLLGPAVAGRMAEMTASFIAPSALAAFLLIMGIFLIKSE